MIHLTDRTFMYAKVGSLAAGLSMIFFILFPWLFGIEPEVRDRNWGDARIASLLVGINLVLISALISSRQFRLWVVKGLGYRLMSPLHMLGLILVRSALALAGITITAVVLFADFFGIDPTPGFGWLRLSQLGAGLLLLLATFVLYSKPVQRLLIDLLGEIIHVRLQVILLASARLVLFTVGLVTMFLSCTADYFGFDSTPGWGADRTIQLVAGFSMLLAGYVLYNRPMQLWFVRHLGFRMLTPKQVAFLVMLQVLLLVSGLTVVVVVVLADKLGIDPTPGWGLQRWMQLVAGLALIAASFVLLNRSLIRWLWRRHKISGK